MSLRFPDLIGNLSFVKKSILCFKHGIADFLIVCFRWWTFSLEGQLFKEAGSFSPPGWPGISHWCCSTGFGEHDGHNDGGFDGDGDGGGDGDH